MARRTLNRHELRAAVEAAEALEITNRLDSQRPANPRAGTEPARRPRPEPSRRMRVIWAVCDLGGRTVATFEYPQKTEAEALIAHLKAQGKGTHFHRSVKEPISSGSPSRAD
jgi:hypothetical protein